MTDYLTQKLDELEIDWSIYSLPYDWITGLEQKLISDSFINSCLSHLVELKTFQTPIGIKIISRHDFVHVYDPLVEKTFADIRERIAEREKQIIDLYFSENPLKPFLSPRKKEFVDFFVKGDPLLPDVEPVGLLKSN